jgi:hypothetical protein
VRLRAEVLQLLPASGTAVSYLEHTAVAEWTSMCGALNSYLEHTAVAEWTSMCGALNSYLQHTAVALQL